MARVLLGMSGGVDSCVAASILKRDAHDVVGVTLLFDGGEASRIGAETAAGICEKLGMEHKIVDVRDRYEEVVAQWAMAELELGHEPNVACRCTRKLLIPVLFELADEMKIRHIATGHYAKVVSESGGIGTMPLRLLAAKDKSQDQSFMLYDLSQNQLNRLMFPLADMHEMHVRMAAMREGLMFPELRVGGSQFLFGSEGSGVGSWADGRGVATSGGEIIEMSNGSVIGTHKGLHHYTVSDPTFVDGIEEPRFVAAKDAKLNILFVGSEQQSLRESCQVKDVVWTSIHPLTEKRSCRMRTKREGNARPVQLVPMADGTVTLSFTMPAPGLVSGRTAVFYSDDMVLGGGTII